MRKVVTGRDVRLRRDELIWVYVPSGHYFRSVTTFQTEPPNSPSRRLIRASAI
jgi:hypothetical protein